MITKAKLLDKAKDKAIEALKAQAIKSLTKIADKNEWVGIGVSDYWGLPSSHRFQIAAVQHDAAYYALEILLGQIEWKDLPTKPVNFKYFVEIELKQYAEWKSDPYSFVKRADLEFYETCKKLAGNNLWYRFQAELFYRVVDIWSDLKFEKYKQFKDFALIFNDINQNIFEAQGYYSS